MIATIIDIVKQKLPFLMTADDVVVELEIVQSFYALQKYLLKTDTEVEIETNYTNLQKMLVAYYTAYNLVQRKALVNLQGENGTATQINQIVKKVKADVVETEFQEANSGNYLILDAEKISNGLKLLVCQTATTLNIRLPICSILKKAVIPFEVYK